MQGEIKSVETIYLVVAVDKYTKKWYVLNDFYNDYCALKYLELVPKLYPEYNHFFVCSYVKNEIIAEIKPH